MGARRVFIRWDVRGRVLGGWAFSWAACVLPRLRKGRLRRASVVQEEAERLYDGVRVRDLVAAGRARLHLLATSFTTGHLVAFGENRMRFVGAPGSALPEPESIPAHDVPVALGVTASSAFPPLFPPLRVNHETFGAHENVFPN